MWLTLWHASSFPADVYVYPGSGATHDTLHDKQQQMQMQQVKQEQEQQQGQQGPAPGAPTAPANNGATPSSSARPPPAVTAAGAGGFQAPELGVKPVVGSGGDAPVHPAPAAAVKVEGQLQVRALWVSADHDPATAVGEAAAAAVACLPGAAACCFAVNPHHCFLAQPTPSSSPCACQ